MNIMHVTASQIEDRRRERPPGYFEQIAPAKLGDTPDGGAEYDADHPAWLAAVAAFRPTVAGATEGMVRTGGCSGCGGRSLITLTGDPAAIGAALAEEV